MVPIQWKIYKDCAIQIIRVRPWPSGRVPPMAPEIADRYNAKERGERRLERPLVSISRGCAREGCGILFASPYPDQLYCSKRCSAAAAQARRNAKRPGRLPADPCVRCGAPGAPAPLRGAQSKYCSHECRRAADLDQKNAHPDRPGECCRCGAPARRASYFCSHACHAAFQKHVTAIKNVIAHCVLCQTCGKEMLSCAATTHDETIMLDGSITFGSITFGRGWHRRKYCSAECRDRLNRDRRRHRVRQAFVEPVSLGELIEADRGICQLCFEPVDLGRRGTIHRLAPTLDHIIPLARGGMHERANCQLAHFGCNSSKRDRIAA